MHLKTKIQKTKKLLASATSAGLGLLIAAQSYAQDVTCGGVDTKSTIFGAFRKVSCRAGFLSAGDPGEITTESLAAIVGLIINIALSLTGLVFVILIIYGGFLWMTARGNESQVQESETLIRNSIIGIIITLSAFVISQFIIRTLAQTALQAVPPS